MIEFRKTTDKENKQGYSFTSNVLMLGEETHYLTDNAILELRDKLNKFAIHNVIKCSNCGDTGRGKPTLQEPDGEECKECFSSCL